MSIKELPDLIDAYAEAREARLAKQREVDALQRDETSLKNSLIEMLREQDLSAAGSANYMVTYSQDEKPIAGDWEEIYGYIYETKSFDLLQRRLLESAVKARWEDGVTIPGVVTYPVDKLSVSRVKT